MKKRTLFVLLTAVFFMLVGSALFLFPLFSQNSSSTPAIYTVDNDFQQIEIDLKGTTLTVCSDENTYIEINGYRESEYYISEEDGKLLLTDRFEKSPLLFRLSGIGRYIKERRQMSGEKHIILHLSQEHSHTPINLILKNSNLTLSAPIDYLTLNAEDSSVTVRDMTFERFNGKLTNCESLFSLPYSAFEFSRNIETHNTLLSLNGDERANTEQFITDFQKPSFTVEAFGGTCCLEYPQDTP